MMVLTIDTLFEYKTMILKKRVMMKGISSGLMPSPTIEMIYNTYIHIS